MPFLTQGKTNWKFIGIVVVLVVVVGVGILAYQYWWMPKEEDKNTQKPIAYTQEAKPYPDESRVSRAGPNREFTPRSVTYKEENDNSSATKPTGKTTAYQITISEINSSIKESGWLSTYLENLFDLPVNSISRIVFDTRKGQSYENIYNSTYYILVISENDLKPEYEKGNIRVQTSKINELISYIQDPDYCETDEDCVIRGEFCAKGSFNYYRGFYDCCGCEGALYLEESEEILDICDKETQHVEIEYSGSKCLNHQCLAQNKIMTCVEGVIP